MKRIITTLCMILVAVVAMWAKTYVIAAGVSSYKGQNHLDYAAQDAAQFAQIMKKAGSQVTLMTSKNATHDNIVAAIRRAKKVAGPNDRLVFLFCGHGGEGKLLCYDDPRLKNTYLPYSELLSEINDVNAAQKILFIHSCHSGSAGDVVNADSWAAQAKSNNIAMFLSSDATEYTYESNFSSGGFFCRALFNCLHGLCDANGDKKVTIKEMQDYIYDDVVSRSQGKQHPQLFYGNNMLNAVFLKL